MSENYDGNDLDEWIAQIWLMLNLKNCTCLNETLEAVSVDDLAIVYEDQGLMAEV